MNTKKPNILFICTDQLRYDCLGFAQKYPVKTPNLDALARDGAWFNKAYSTIPTCCPARQSMLAGRRPESFMAYWNYDMFPVPTLTSDQYTFVDSLKEQGYSTGHYGKWHVSPTENALDFGFEEYSGYEHHTEFVTEKYPTARRHAPLMGATCEYSTEDNPPYWFAQKTIEAIDKFSSRENPWFVRYDLSEPHLTCHPSKEFSDMYCGDDTVCWDGFNDDFINKPYIQKQQVHSWEVQDLTWDDWKHAVAKYYAVITEVDYAIGKVIDHLKEKGMYEDTTIIFTSDHGDMCGSHHMVDKHHIMYEDVLHVPLIVKMSNHKNKGQIIDGYVLSGLDLAPTTLELIGAEPKDDYFHGASYIPLIENDDKVEGWRTSAICTYNGQQFGLYSQRCIIKHPYKLVWNATDVDELYHLENDPGELCNLVADDKYLDLIHDLSMEMFEELKKDGDKFYASGWTRKQIQSRCKLRTR